MAYQPTHRGELQPELKHLPKPDGSCSLRCNCPTPLTSEEVELLDKLGIF